MEKDSYVDCYIELPPRHMEVYKKVLEDNHIEQIMDLVKLDEDEFRNLKGITPLMFVKTRRLLTSSGYKFGMTDDDLLDMEEDIYFKKKPIEKDIAKMENNELQKYLGKQEKNEESEICSVTDEETEEVPMFMPPFPNLPEEEQTIEQTVEAESKARTTAELKWTDQEIKRLRMKEYDNLSPLGDTNKCDLQYFRMFAILDTFRSDPWYTRIFHSYRDRVRKAVIVGNYLFKVWLEDAKFRHEQVTERREHISDELRNLEVKRYNLRQKLS